jgi:tetratricopeptide (TPR) repeat protein
VQTTEHYPIDGRIENAFVSYCRYLGKAFWPENLTVFYPHPGHWSWMLAVAAAVLVLLICLLVVWQGRRFPFLVMGWFWFLGTFIPVIGLVQVGPQAMADRYAYVPLIGVFILFSWGAAYVFSRWQIPKTVIATAALILLSACALTARNQLAYWQNDETLFQHAVTLVPTYTTGHLALASYLEHQGRADEAMTHYRLAIQLAPNNLPAHVNLGAMLVKSGRLQDAADEFREAIRIAPQSAEVHYNLGCILFQLGQRDGAIEQLQQALRLKPDFALAQQALQAINGQ